MPWWPDKVWRRAASRDRVHTRPCAAPFMQAGSPHSAPQFEPPRRNRRGHSRLVSSPREHLDTSAAGVPVCAGQRSCVRSAAADANAPRWVVKPAHRKLLVYANVFVERELRPRVWCELYTRMHAARNQREHESRHCTLTPRAVSPTDCIMWGTVTPHRLVSYLTSGWVESRKPGEL
jgi:hypothetical protein